MQPNGISADHPAKLACEAFGDDHMKARATVGDVDEDVILTTRDSVATITFNRPASRNAMPLRTWLAIPSLIAAAEQEASTRLIVVRGAAGHFGAGNDIVEFGVSRRDPSVAREFGWAMASAMAAVEAASKPVIMAIEGACYGASVALALAGDLRVAADTSVFAITPAKLGVIYLKSDLQRLSAAIGSARAKRLILTAGPIDAAEAKQIGLADEVYPAVRFDERLRSLVASILRGSPYTLRRTREMLRMTGSGPTPSETDESISWFVEATQGPDFSEGVTAFLEKREPQFG